MSATEQPTDTCRALILAKNRRTGTLHVACREWGNAICGALPHNPTWEASAMLGDFPEDFGSHPDDCQTCASMDVAEHVTTVERSDYWD